jgi:hypothetical protein
MAAIGKDGLDQFRVKFGELAKTRRGEPVQVDPFLIAQAIALVMRECTVRAATGNALVWNDYRVILARKDFDFIRPLQAPLERDLRTVLAQEARARAAELVGELRVTVVFDEADELAQGTGVVRVAFVPTDKLAAPRAGEMTMRLDAWQVAGEIVAKAPRSGEDTVHVADTFGGQGVPLRWSGGAAEVALATTYVLGRDHAESPPKFIGLGTGSTINKQHIWIAASGTSLRIGRFAKANPVHVNGQLLAPGDEVEVPLPAEISLSRGDLVLVLG